MSIAITDIPTSLPLPGFLRARVAAVIGLGPRLEFRRAGMTSTRETEGRYRYSLLLETEDHQLNGDPCVVSCNLLAPAPHVGDFSLS